MPVSSMTFEYLPSGITFSSFDECFLYISDDIFDRNPSRQTSKTVGDAIGKWNQEQTTMINKFKSQMSPFNKVQRQWAEKKQEKLEETSAKIIQTTWRQ